MFEELRQYGELLRMLDPADPGHVQAARDTLVAMNRLFDKLKGG